VCAADVYRAARDGPGQFDDAEIAQKQFDDLLLGGARSDAPGQG
jgi:hypothetical protein